MFERFFRLEANLRKAGYVLSLEVAGGVALAVLLSQFGLNSDLALLFVWVANLPAAWFLARAARHQGRNPWLIGLISLPPLLGLLQFLSLSAMSSHYKRFP